MTHDGLFLYKSQFKAYIFKFHEAKSWIAVFSNIPDLYIAVLGLPVLNIFLFGKWKQFFFFFIL